MLSSPLKAHLEDYLGRPIKKHRPISGGDISDAYLLETSDTRLFLKVNSGEDAARMFELEKAGLAQIAASNTIAIPKVFGTGQLGNIAYLILEFIESRQATTKDQQELGIALAQLHQHTQIDFGWDRDNFIGSLDQVNKPAMDWAHFYWHNRLSPQMERALKTGLLSANEVPSQEGALAKLNEYFKQISPSLLHGDLWSGNYLIGVDGRPYLIDPAVYYGHYEVDLAMSQLFGGFGKAFYEAHAQIFVPQSGRQARIEIYQLYYLLVHLNLFGRSYFSPVSRILRRYF